jgi:hypothetical protein
MPKIPKQAQSPKTPHILKPSYRYYPNQSLDRNEHRLLQINRKELSPLGYSNILEINLTNIIFHNNPKTSQSTIPPTWIITDTSRDEMQNLNQKTEYTALLQQIPHHLALSHAFPLSLSLSFSTNQ